MVTCFLPTIVTFVILLIAPSHFSATISYSRWQPTRQQFDSLIVQFYNENNLRSLVNEFRQAGANDYADMFGAAVEAWDGTVKRYVRLGPVPDFPPYRVSNRRSADDLAKDRNLRAERLVVTVARCPSPDMLQKLTKILRRDMEQSLSLYTIIFLLQDAMSSLHMEQADIGDEQFATKLMLDTDRATLDRIKTISPVATSEGVGSVVLRLEAAAGADDQTALPLQYRIPMLEARIIRDEENLKKTEATLAYIKRLLGLWQQCLDELKSKDIGHYYLNDYLDFLDGLMGAMQETELQSALRSHIARIRALQYTNGPDSEYLTIEKSSKGAAGTLTLVFAGSVLLSLATVFLVESVRRRHTA